MAHAFGHGREEPLAFGVQAALCAPPCDVEVDRGVGRSGDWGEADVWIVPPPQKLPIGGMFQAVALGVEVGFILNGQDGQRQAGPTAGIDTKLDAARLNQLTPVMRVVNGCPGEWACRLADRGQLRDA